MKKINTFTTVFFLVLLAATTPMWAQTPPELTLEYFESRAEESALVNKQHAAVSSQTHMKQYEQARSGLKLLTSAGVSRNNEPVDDFSRRSYDQIFVKGGLTYPIFGSYLAEQDRIQDVQTLEAIEKARLNYNKQLVLEQIRGNYIDYWTTSKQIELARTFLETQTAMTSILDERTKADILFESDRMEFMTAFALVRRDLSNLMAKQQQALLSLNSLCGTSFAEFKASTPVLPNANASLNATLNKIFKNPQLEIADILTNKYLEKTSKFYSRSLEGNLNIFQSYSEDDPGGHGTSSLASVTLKLPVQHLQAHRQLKKYNLSEFKKYFFDQQIIFNELYTKTTQLFYEYSARKTNIMFARQRLDAAKLAMKEAYLRANVLEGDVIEKLHQRRYAYYRVAFDAEQALNMLAKTCAQLMFTTTQTGPTTTPLDLFVPQTQPEIIGMQLLKDLTEQKSQEQLTKTVQQVFQNKTNPPPPPVYPLSGEHFRGAYFWNTQNLLSKRYIYHDDPDVVTSLPLWDKCANMKLQTLLMSLNASQIEYIHKSPIIHARFGRFLQTAQSKNINISLLLGDPSWIQHPEGLMQIIQKLKSQPFTGLHLDIEPSQLNLPESKMPELLEKLSYTLWQVTRISPWPVSISVHPRVLNTQLPDGTLFADNLEKLRLDYVSLMIYISNAAKAADRGKALADQFPGINFALACSVEPPETLPPENSFYLSGTTKFEQGLKTMLDTMGKNANFCGLLIQDLISLEKMKNENKL